MFSESGFTHSDHLRGHNQNVGRSLKVNGPFCRDTYKLMQQWSRTRLTSLKLKLRT
ncbi:hypothetical protein A9E70_001087 [Salmonella enterica subsp. enterica serovar Hvittingfoss]|nr:hypothetical protein [Salmonella enterica subsp. enterica serovar Hvittingfoss]EDU3767004.1 hypothetical protein [Salmonella enterica subsp. enterica serovar Minnesota]EDU5179748.1 hypothetical protein [Salmonella enterica]EDY4086125.1 hypothetical protein [Salmonella enterica subsp. enterica]EEJ6617962.1 hypothetical protein [Salmonella enterica subsp. enterica serovar Anatum]